MGSEDVTIRVSDQGGGIPRRMTDTLFEYLYTTAPSPVLTSSVETPGMAQLGIPAPIAGHGYGLPLARLYARYLNGDIELSSIEGYGTEVFVYLQALESEAKERLPVYHETGSKKIYEAKLTASDWTESIKS
jgi:pyruvate dehydrogenase kinase 2/3/4